MKSNVTARTETISDVEHTCNQASVCGSPAQCQRLVKGYGDTHERGLRDYETLLTVVQKAGVALAPATLRELRDAAPADERGDRLRATLTRYALA